jgi:cation diffusion facilitator family transporter
MTKEQTAIRTTYFSIIGNTCLAIIKALAGIFGHSYALIADAIESTSDIFASLLVLFGLKYASRPADQNHPYGHGRVEPLITFGVVGFLVISATIITYESIEHIRTPHPLPKPFTLFILGGIILWKEISYRVVIKRSLLTNSSSLKADAWHHRSDVITSVTAFIGISVALYLGKGYEAADDWAALIASMLILYNSYMIFRPALGEIMDENLYEDLKNEVREIAIHVPGVIATEKCLIRKTGMYFLIDLHIIVDSTISVREGHTIGHILKDRLIDKLPNIADVLVHIEPN